MKPTKKQQERINEILPVLKKWEQTVVNVVTEYNKLRDLLRFVECDLTDAIDSLIYEYTESISTRIGDDFGWMQWYLYDNYMGRNGLYVYPYNDKHAKRVFVENIKDLALIIACE